LGATTGAKQRVSLDDAAWLHMDSAKNPMVVNTLVTFDHEPDWDEVVAGLEHRVLPAFPRFGQRVTQVPLSLGQLGGPHWEDDLGFSLDRHVERVTLGPGDFGEQLREHVGDEASTLLDRSRPRWKLQLISSPNGQAAALLRTHHSMGDGLLLVQVLLALADLPSGHDSHRGQMPIAIGGRSDSDGSSASPTLGEGLTGLSDLRGIRAAADGARANAKVYRKLAMLADQKNPMRAPLTGAKSMTWTDPVPLDAVKLVAKATDSTVNDVALTVLAGALYRYFAHDGAVPYRVGVTVPFNLRDLDEPLDPTVGNQIGLVFISLPVGIEDRRARLDHIRRRMAKIKASPEGEVVRGGMAMVGAIPTKGMAKAWMELFNNKCTAIVTNIVGPRAPISVGGAPVTDFVLWVPTSGSIGVGLSIVTYADSLRLGVQVDDGVVAEPERLLEAMHDELSTVDQLVFVSRSA
jgi:diacylglycerol O-acyltransferase / wax synthase